MSLDLEVGFHNLERMELEELKVFDTFVARVLVLRSTDGESLRIQLYGNGDTIELPVDLDPPQNRDKEQGNED